MTPYGDNAKAFIEKLTNLHAEGKALLKDKKNRTILPFHGSLAYFAKSFDLKLVDPIQDVPGQEPTARQLEKIVDNCVKHNVRVIAVEPQYGAGSSARVIVDALKQKGLDPVVIVIDPLETCPDGEMSRDWYERKMRANLEALAKALQ
jgi:zinc transport system substrate-binding protein